MEIEMSEIQSIKATLNQQGAMLSSLDKRAAVTDSILESIQETQKGIAKILESQITQREKNKYYETVIEKSEAASLRRDKEISDLHDEVTSNKIQITSILARLVIITSVLSTAAVMLAQYVSKSITG